MANNYRNGKGYYGCLDSMGGRRRGDNYPYYDGPCPDEKGVYDYGVRRGRDEGCAVFSAMLPMAVAANGVIPLANGNRAGVNGIFPVNGGMITIEEEGTYLATYTVRVPEGERVDSTLTLNVNDASQSTAIAEIGGEGPAGFTAQAIFDVGDSATVALRSSEAINIIHTSPQPLVTLSLVKL